MMIWTCAELLNEDQWQRCIDDSSEMVEGITSNPSVLESLITCDENWVYCYDRETVPSGKPKKAKQRRSIGKLMIIPFFDSKSIIYIHWVPHMARQSTKSMRQVRDFIWHLHLDNALLQQNYPSDQLLGWYGHQDCPSSSLQSRLKPTLLLYF